MRREKKEFVADFTTGVLNVPHVTPILVLPVVPETEYLGPGLINWTMVGPCGP